ncbi:MAG TPA: hypothetical protein VLH60_03260, partial [Sedimentisphaerales bacterium]|nr:hypothetical protein [Sedimentisphaerales bacterium]
AVIDQFVHSVVQELLARTDFADVSQTRDAFTTRLESRVANPRYAEVLVAAVEQRFVSGLAEADRISDADRRRRIKLNLLMMLDSIGQITTARIASAHVGDQDAGVRYWAVKNLANPAVISRLNAAGQGNIEAIREIASSLKAIIPAEANAKILDLLVDFGSGVNAPEATDLLVTLANRRISDHEKWDTQHELLDGRLLNALCARARADRAAAAAFGQLLSHCMSKYIRYLASPSPTTILGEQQAVFLATALIVAERGCLGELRGGGGSAIQNAIARGAAGASALMGEYTLLFGDAGNPGQLTRALNIRYVDAAGVEQALPRPLPDKPGTVSN